MANNTGSVNAPATAGGRSYTSGRFALELDSQEAGFIQSMDGGGISADVIVERVGPDHIAHKHIGAPKYEDVTIESDFSLLEALYEWIAQTWKAQAQRRDISITTLDFNNNIRGVDEYYNALISEVSLPACDASSKEPGRLSVKFTPEYTRHKKGSGKLEKIQGKSQQKSWLASNFRLEIDGLDCSKVSRIESITVKQSVIRDVIGERRDYQLEPTSVEFPNLLITLAEISAESWLKWHEDFVIKGNNGSDQEKSGALTLLAPNRQSALARINLAGLGIFKITRDKVEASSDQIKRVAAGLYVEKMEYLYKDIGL